MEAPLIVAPNHKLPSQLGQPLVLKVDIKGGAPSSLKWQIGRKKVKESSKYHLIYDPETGQYGLDVKKVTEELKEGVWVVACNHHGEDCCHIEVDVEGAGDETTSAPVKSEWCEES